MFVDLADAQTGVLVARRTTTNATPVELFLDGSSQRLTLADQDCWAFSVLVVGRRTDAGGEGAGYRFEGVIHRNGNSTAIIGTRLNAELGESSAGWDAEVTADDTNESLKITVRAKRSQTPAQAVPRDEATPSGNEEKDGRAMTYDYLNAILYHPKLRSLTRSGGYNRMISPALQRIAPLLINQPHDPISYSSSVCLDPYALLLFSSSPMDRDTRIETINPRFSPQAY
ncbi:MAG: hypothetical protein GXY83_08455 [Rhodopirellula sp.]|nr:hypothetical protein [Rhodopirellula sp.]